jgi:ankyrin repeat protein
MKIVHHLLLGFTILINLPLQAINHENQQEELNQQLLEAAQKSDVSNITTLLKAGADINAKDRDGYTPLHYATVDGHVDVVTLLLEHGAHVDEVNGEDETPLYLAVQSGCTDVVTLLLKHGAEINSTNWYGLTPLCCAAGAGDVDVVRLLLQHKASFDKANNYGWTPLHGAAAEGHVDVVALLLNHSARVDRTDKRGGTPLHKAANWGHAAVVTLLLNHDAHVNKVDKFGEIPLYRAVMNNHLTTAHLLKVFSTPELQAFRADPKKYLEEHSLDERFMGATLLHFAVLCNKPAIVTALLKEKAAILAGDDSSHSPLLYALWFGYIAIAQELIKILAQQRKGNVVGALTLTDTNGSCALSYIAENRYRFLNYLITHHQFLASVTNTTKND